jgi:2-oxo-4-hydroxy-4-carboxy--5-ureidoimidazoline (OHCU) decarboxylase
MTREGFLARLGPVSENRPDDLAEAVWPAGPDAASAQALHRGFVGVLRGLSPAARREFLNARPDLVGRPLEQGRVTRDSAEEQGSAGLDALDEAARARFSR